MDSDRQRRWWFATHPEYSWSRKGAQSREDGPEPKHSSGHPVADPDSYDEYEDALHRKERYERDFLNKPGLIESHTALDLIPIGRSFRASELSFQWFLKRLARGSVVYAGKPKKKGGPGTWEWVCRSILGLEHQSQMSGQPIRYKDGKYYIKEYVVPVEGSRNPVCFDDFKDGVYIEYKGKQGNLIKKDGYFYEWAKIRAELRDQAERQVKAAQGSPVVWSVGEAQRPAFDKEVGRIPGLFVKP